MSAEAIVMIKGKTAALQVDSSRGVFFIIDYAGNTQWTPDPWLNAAGILVAQDPAGLRRQFVLGRDGEVAVTALSPGVVEIAFSRWPLPNGEGILDGKILTRLSLAEDDSSFRIEVVDVRLPAEWSFVDLEYPCRLGALRTDVDQGYLVLPYRQGSLVPSTTRAFVRPPLFDYHTFDDASWDERGSQDLLIYSHAQITMPFYGIINDGNGLIAILETENDASFRCLFNHNGQKAYSARMQMSPLERLAACSPVWKSEFGKFGYKRSMLLAVLPGADHNAVAKHYRLHAQKTGLAVTLREKIDANPNIDNLLGGSFIQLNAGYPFYIDYPAFRMTWRDAATFVDFLSSRLGMKRGLLSLWMGYSNYPPDSWPFHPAQGPVEDLKALVEYARARNIMICFYHGYPAMLDHAPNCDPKRARQTTPQGNMGTRWGRHCSHFYLEYAKKNLPPTIRDAGHWGDYSDILTSLGLEECYGYGHEHTRSKDRQNREETLQYINSLGLFTGSEHLQGYAVPYSVYSKWGTVGWREWLSTTFPVPLFNLVYHDCFIAYTMGLMRPALDSYRSFAAGCHHHQVFFNWQSFLERKDGPWHDHRLFWDFQRQTGLKRLVSYTFEDEFDGPYHTLFSDGSQVLVNPTAESREVQQQLIQPESMAIRIIGKKAIHVAIKRPEWRIEQTGN